jgi:hypothetical protein
MKNTSPRKILASVSLDLAGRSARMEKLLAAEGGHPDIRIHAARPDGAPSAPLVLTEDQLIELLHRASHAGVLSPGFFGKLREKIEI